MASELHPCPFCGSNQLSFRSTPDMDTDGKYHRISCNECGASSRATFAMDACPLFFEELSNVWNTRPAPAATDTGLVTAMTVRVEDAGDAGITAQVDDLITGERGLLELVTRSQAEEILAAERAKYRDAMEKLVESQRETLVWQQRAIDLKADNAAQAARIKELETERTMIVSHATMGGTNGIGLTVNEISVCVTALRNELYEEGEKRAEALGARIKELEEYAREATKAITGLTGGGSENFSKEIGDVFTADLPYCLERIRERYVSKVELKHLETKLAAAEKALEEIRTMDATHTHELRAVARAVLGGKPS